MCTDLDLLIAMLRVILDDLDSSVYTDEKLIKVLAVATKLVFGEVEFLQTYTITIDLSVPEFDVCPEASDLIYSLITLKAACIIDAASLRNQSTLEGIKATCGPINIQKSSGADAFKLLMEEGPCASYKLLKEKANFDDKISSASYFKAIMGPFISNTFKICQSCGTRGSCNCL